MLIWPAVASLVPLAAFMAVVGIGEGFALEGALVLLGLPLYAMFVSAPSFFPIAVAREGWLRWATVVVMTVTAVVAGVMIVESDDAQAGLAVLVVAYVGVPLGTVVWIGRAIADARASGRGSDREEGPVPGMHRLAALVIDALVIGAAVFYPLRELSHAGQEVAAAIVGGVFATVALAVPVALGGQTLGHRALRIRVVDARSGGRVGFGRAALRSVVVVGEAMLALTGALAVVAVFDLAVVLGHDRSLGDRAGRTYVVRAA